MIGSFRVVGFKGGGSFRSGGRSTVGRIYEQWGLWDGSLGVMGCWGLWHLGMVV